MSSPTRQILLVDDDVLQLKLCALRLRDAGFEVETACGGDEALEKVKRRTPDAIMSDVLMGGLDGFGLCRQLRTDPALAHVPIILLSAHYQDQPDQKLARHVGASVLVSRTPEFEAELAALRESLLVGSTLPEAPPDAAVYEEHLRTNANQMSKLLGRAQSAEGRYSTLFEHASDTITLLTTDGFVVEANRRWHTLTGFEPAAMIGKHIRDFAVAGREDESVNEFNRAAARGGGRSPTVPVGTTSGDTIYMDFSSANVELDGRPMVLAIGRDVTDQVLAAKERATAEEKYRSLVERLPDVIWTCDLTGAVTFMTQNAEHVLGYTAEEMMAEDFETRSERVHPDDRDRIRVAFTGFLDAGTPLDVEYRRRRKDGNYVWLRNRFTASYERAGVRFVEGMISDITERKRLEETLRQSQKMEAIGQLTGGIAHDFNNILAVILANAQFLYEDLGEHDPRRVDAEEIASAAERAAQLTRQLLAFSRHQVLESTIVDLGSVVSGVEKMLRRLIGEDLEFDVHGGEGLGSVRVDIGQVEQVIVNLVVNARDAMPTGGRLAIETSNVEVDAELAIQLGATAGSYVMLAISDTGCGMDANTKGRIFEPFFTTKEIGKGTGLGLSTVYGIVKQSGGHISVYSEVGHGTVFRVYLPRVEGAPPVRKVGRRAVGGTETILVVEDDEKVRNAIHRVLQPRGYKLLVSTSAVHALELATKHEGHIDLVLSDVIMPGLSGPDLVEQLTARLGAFRTLYMSGYTDHEVLRTGVLDAGVNFVQKPFTQDALARKIREALDA